MTAPPPQTARAWAGQMLIVALVVAAVWPLFPAGWIAEDEGTLAQAAVRTMAGEMPHRDFVELYTGGLAHLYAAAFRVLGTNLLTIRIVMFAFMIAWIPVLWWIARRFVAGMGAVLVVILSILWSVPAYPAGMPSWYNLFFATAGLAALLKFLERGGVTWLVVAGAAGGVSCLAKISGIWFIAGALLFLLWRAATQPAASGDPPGANPASTVEAPPTIGRPSWSPWVIFVVCAAGLVVCALVALVGASRFNLSNFAHFVVPGAALAVATAFAARAAHALPGLQRVRILAVLVVPFLIGVALPLALFAWPYLRADALGDLIHGVFVLPARRLSAAAKEAPNVLGILASVPLLAYLGFVTVPTARWPRWARLGLLWMPVVLVLAGSLNPVHRFVTYSVRHVLALACIGGALLLTRNRPRLPDAARARTMLALCIAGFCTLVQFPYAVSGYFLFVAPLVAIAMLAWATAAGISPRRLKWVALFYAAFAAFHVAPGFLMQRPKADDARHDTAVLPLERGRISIRRAEAEVYEHVVALVRAHARGSPIYAGPDSPEVSFLAKLPNATRTLWELYDEPVGMADRLLTALNDRHVHVVALKLSGAALPAPLMATLHAQYPHSERVGQFDVRWDD